MGEIELRGRKRAQRRNLQQAILNSVAVAGILAISVAAPNVITALHKLGMLPSRNDIGAVNRARQRLLRQGLLIRDGDYLKLSMRGEAALALFQARELSQRPRRKWDGRWRILMFDIPERRKSQRERIRETLRSIGFVLLQDSVWVYPYDCEDLVALLKANLKVGKDMLYLIVDEMESDTWLRNRFKLPRR